MGEIEARSAGRPLDVGTPRQQVVLAALAVDVRRPIALETLIDRVWDHDPPANARPVLYAHLSRIRGLLGQTAAPGGGTAARIERRHAGYVLEADPQLVDLHRFRRLVERGTDPQHDEEARASALAEALGLWRGEPLAGLPGAWAAHVRASCHRRRLDAVVWWARAEFRLGRPTAVISAVPDLTAEYPLAEPLECVLIQALHAAGRGAEALDRYGTVRRRLAEELGTDPGEELRAVYQTVLRGDPPAPGEAGPAPRTTGPGPLRSRAADTPPPVARRRADPVSAGVGAPPGAGAPAPARTAAPRPGSPGTPTSPEVPPGLREPAVTDPPSGRRRAVLAVLVAMLLPAATGSAHVLRRDEGERDGGGRDGTGGSQEASAERARELFAAAEAFDQEGRADDARAAAMDAVRLWGELIGLDPDRYAPPLAPAVLRALGRAGVDFSVLRPALLGWLGNPVHTPYPAISQVILVRGWRFTAPVFLDVVVWNYEHTPGAVSPRDVADVRTDVLKAAVLENTRTRHGTGVTEFDQLLRP
ncbi:BTAD domain-containing putative transcriptional regulator [Streptomyces yaizuensis]|uniref:Winged helix-turn-helix domain-containing protein n=1 Tax=Streptomyces yaizuensis TaxID=2989713 RepID=A0ABQ5P8E9_9ACTN|nr:BTAD domain-containing putative transcriptional regulator [Streptomyces sp. YSPA8]GLF98842.1 winged helix-turn-helix domain-containing protein [Streptomyces sp. YSPA8]